MTDLSLEPHRRAVREAESVRILGRVTSVRGMLIASRGPAAGLGELLRVASGALSGLNLEVVGFTQDAVLCMPLGGIEGLTPGTRLVATGALPSVPVGDGLRGRVLNALGEPIDAGGPVRSEGRTPLVFPPGSALTRTAETRALMTGVRAVDHLLTLGRGQRIGVFAPSGTGKTTLLAMMARGSEADVNVIALVGERGREVRPFIESALGPGGLERSVVVVSTSDEAPVMRVRAAYAATAIAESFRRRGRHVLLVMDSLTRFATAQREIGLAAGEPATTKGFTPSVSARLAHLIERAGSFEGGSSITALYSVLVESDALTDPVADTLLALLDGHIVLSRENAQSGQFPAVDPLRSLSRLMPDVVDDTTRRTALQCREVFAKHRAVEDLLALGAYVKGSDPRTDRALSLIGPLLAFLRQCPEETGEFGVDAARLASILGTGSA